jgi:hypothetical protein
MVLQGHLVTRPQSDLTRFLLHILTLLTWNGDWASNDGRLKESDASPVPHHTIFDASDLHAVRVLTAICLGIDVEFAWLAIKAFEHASYAKDISIELRQSNSELLGEQHMSSPKSSIYESHHNSSGGVKNYKSIGRIISKASYRH